MLRISTRTLDYWRDALALPCVERNGYVRFLMSDLKDFISAHRVASAHHFEEPTQATTELSEADLAQEPASTTSTR